MSAPTTDRFPGRRRFSETVDWTAGRVCATGPVTAVAADLLAGTADQLRRAGHSCITVELDGARPPDEEGLTALCAVVEELRARHCDLVIRWETKEHS